MIFVLQLCSHKNIALVVFLQNFGSDVTVVTNLQLYNSAARSRKFLNLS